jgi:hypothetical protein
VKWNGRKNEMYIEFPTFLYFLFFINNLKYVYKMSQSPLIVA